MLGCGQGGGLREELDSLSSELRRVGATLRGSFENLLHHCTFTFSTSNLTPTVVGKPIQIGHRRIKVNNTPCGFTLSSVCLWN